MRSRVPWNVSGIPPELREAARRAAEKAGVPLSEWLEAVIADRTGGAEPAFDPDPDKGAADMSAGSSYQRRDEYGPGYNRMSGSRSRESGYTSRYDEPAGGAVGDLHRRIEDAERRQFSAVEQLDKAVAAVADRLESADRLKAAADSAMRAAAEAFEASTREQTTAFESLERSVGGMVARLEESAAKADGALVAAQALPLLQTSINELKQRIEDSSARASSTNGELEKAIAALVGRLGTLEQSHSNAVDTTFADMKRQLGAAESRALESANAITSSFATLSNRLNGIEDRHGVFGTETSRSREQLGALEQAVAQLREQATGAESRAAEVSSSVANTLAQIAERLSGLEARQGAAASEHDRTRTVFDSFEASLASLRAQAAQSDTRANEAANTVGASLSAISERLAGFEERQTSAARELKRSVEEVAAAHAGEIRTLTERLGEIDGRQSNAARDTESQIAKVTGRQDGEYRALADRLTALEARNAETSRNLKDTLVKLVQRWEERGATEPQALKLYSDEVRGQAAAIQAHANLFKTHDDALKALDARTRQQDGRLAAIDETVRAVDARSRGAEGRLATLDEAIKAAIGGSQAAEGRFAGLDEALKAAAARHQASEGRIASLDDAMRAANARLAEAEARLSERLKEGVSAQALSLKSYADTVGEVAKRLDTLERKAAEPPALPVEDIAALRAGIADAANGMHAQADRIEAFEGDLKAVRDLASGAMGANADLLRRLDELANRPEPEIQAVAAPDPEAVSRLSALEQSLQTLAVQVGHSERRQGETASTIEQALRGVGARVDASDKRNRDVLTSVQTQLELAMRRLEALELAPVPSASHVAEEQLPPPPAYRPDGDDFTDRFAPPRPEAFEPRQAEPMAPPFDDDDEAFEQDGAYGTIRDLDEPVPPPMADQADPDVEAAIAEVLGRPEEPPTRRTDDFLSAARRAAQAAAAADADALAAKTKGKEKRASRYDASVGGAEKTNWLRLGLILAGILVIAAALYFVLMRQKPVQEPVAPVTGEQPVTPPPASAETPYEELPPAPPMSGEPAVAPEGPAPTGEEPGATDPQGGTPEPPAATPETGEPTAAAEPEAPKTPMEALLASAEGGDPRAQFELGLRYAEGEGVKKNAQEAAKWLLRAAQAGLPPAQYRMGVLYERGLGVPRDVGQAKIWYERAANAGNRKAMHNLAVIFADGSTGSPDYKSASKWFLAAAELGLKDSQFNVAILFERGLGVDVNLVEAYKWYAAAAAQGDADAGARATALEGRMAADDLAKAKQAVAGFKAKPMNAAANDVPSLKE